jgi:predicted transcriptional regulator
MKKDLDVCSILLTRRELQIMNVIWEEGAATVKQVCDAVSKRKPTAYTTILTFMSILEQKGALVHTKSGRAYVYKPLLSREQATQNHVRDVIMRFFDGCPEKLIADIMENDAKATESFRTPKESLEPWQANEVA